MDEISFILCYKDADRGKAMTKAETLRSQGFNVKLLDGTNIVICDDFKTSPKVCNSTGDFDWIVVLASKTDFADFGASPSN
ncbi:MAG: hypothetical protein ACTS1X_10205 [Parasphingopyxis sp.]|uniref:hypothetical protein n=1 Tax=Parasphingopyxis sp. TaxID=1920299 RepID=UPI003F9F1070